MSDKPSVKIVFAPVFRKAFQRLRKKYRRIDVDLKGLLDQLEVGEIPGDKIPGIHPHQIYKARVPNSDAQRGKSWG